MVKWKGCDVDNQPEISTALGSRVPDLCACAGEGEGGATITDRYVHQSVECQYKSQFLVAEGKCMTWY